MSVGSEGACDAILVTGNDIQFTWRFEDLYDSRASGCRAEQLGARKITKPCVIGVARGKCFVVCGNEHCGGSSVCRFYEHKNVWAHILKI